MKYVIAEDTVKIDYQNSAYWQQFDEIEVKNPKGWYIKYVSGGFSHIFEYSQSTGRGEYGMEYREDVFKDPLPFTDDAKHNAEVMRKTNYDGKRAELVYEP